MKNVLWIPCHNEWTQEVVYMCKKRGLVTWPRHTVYETLQIMKDRINNGLFSKVIITNDWSNDDTLEWVQRFREEEDLRSSVFHIINGHRNEWKMMRFFEAFEMREDAETFVMTDADMVSSSWRTFHTLSNPRSFWGKDMLVGKVGEYCPARRKYDVPESSKGSSSWTRSLLTVPVAQKFSQLQIGLDNLPGKWYGLELLLNALFTPTSNWSTYVNQDEDDFPLFLPPFRKKMWNIQTNDVSFTIRTLAELFGFEKLWDMGKRY